ncbi:hypothetical protein INT43_005135 [Umbelopsis isabellina]|uniref:Uncharacterized protein n=1 Tax=Mortierella isabellina TaxID=91625 RepID=A0A8H7PH28_MORIS|nr:hypothetical protein INT43_005135 [Umbelopsis isabellina]
MSYSQINGYGGYSGYNSEYNANGRGVNALYNGAYGYPNNFEDYTAPQRDFKGAWTAFFALWLLWGLFWFLRHAFGDGHSVDADAEANTKSRWQVGTPHSRLSRGSDVLRDLVVLLLAALAINTFAGGITHAVMILSWIFFGFAVFWAVFEAAVEHHIARFIFGFIFYGIAIAIAALGYRYGWQSY